MLEALNFTYTRDFFSRWIVSAFASNAEAVHLVHLTVPLRSIYSFLQAIVSVVSLLHESKLLSWFGDPVVEKSDKLLK